MTTNPWQGQACAYAYGVDGRSFALHIIRQGEPYGRTGSLIHDEARPIVEFYDTTHGPGDTFRGDLGRMAASYYAHTLMDRDPAWDLSLWSDIPEWTVTGDSLARAMSSDSFMDAVSWTPTSVEA